MAIDFTLTDEQRQLQHEARDFAEKVLAPGRPRGRRRAGPAEAFQITKPAYVEAYKRGIAFCMLPKEYGGGGLRTSTSSSPPRRSAPSIRASPARSSSTASG